MTLALEADTPTAEPQPRKRRRWLVVGVAVFVVAAAGAAIGWLTYIHSYQPLSDDSGRFVSSGPATQSIKPVTDGVSDTNWLLVGPAGTRGTVNYSVSNNGRSAVTILGLDRSDSSYITGVRWAPVNGPNGGGYGYEPGLLSESRALPVTIGPRDEIFLQITVSQPRCGGRNSLDNLGVSNVPIRWSALGVHHIWSMPLGQDQDVHQILLCPSNRALAHIDQR